MKRVALILLFCLLVIPQVLAIECDVGIDNYCDPNCIAVDHDCDANPDVRNQDVLCMASPDGYCDPRCLDSDWDCLVELDVEVNEEILPVELSSTQEEEAVFTPLLDTSDETTIIPLLIVGLSLVAGFFALLIWHREQRQRTQDIQSLHRQVQQSLASGYSPSQIREALKKQGHSDSFINQVLGSLEKRP